MFTAWLRYLSSEKCCRWKVECSAAEKLLLQATLILSHYLQGFVHPSWSAEFLPSTVSTIGKPCWFLGHLHEFESPKPGAETDSSHMKRITTQAKGKEICLIFRCEFTVGYQGVYSSDHTLVQWESVCFLRMLSRPDFTSSGWSVYHIIL